MTRCLCVAAAVLAAACGSSNSSPTQPSAAPSPAPPATVVVHDTLNADGSRANQLVFSSYDSIDPSGRPTPGAYVSDDFATTQNATVRAIAWDGAYCDPRALTPPYAAAVVKSFRITFSSDSGFDSPDSLGVLYDVTLDAAQVHQDHQFDATEEPTCGLNTRTPMSFYRYSVTLPSGFSAVAGRKYWLRIVADVGNFPYGWAWRPTGPGSSWVSYYYAHYAWDMAFRLASQ